ncbi:MAG: putative single-stranded DNA-binding protein [Prokaryotic dsDNA virus sp.]|nr:MAG: putative single-stranded DNA-binding protein [Prokaryotic dsDNA virus sp.]|tara:strand:- start:22137 stop:22502 length:366 start_codon:yes stop_codon:yes gene_type:complete
MLNLTAIGHVGISPQQKTFESGRTVVNFTLAVNHKNKGEDTVSWINCSIWGARGETIMRFVKKGDKLCVNGEAQLTKSNDEDANTYLNLNVQNFTFLNSKTNDNSESDDTIPVAPIQRRRF